MVVEVLCLSSNVSLGLSKACVNQVTLRQAQRDKTRML
jgi:hypothetical protein